MSQTIFFRTDQVQFQTQLTAVRGAIFDLDGTLLDSTWLWDAVDRRFFLNRNMQMPPDYPEAIRSMELLQMAKYTVQRFDLKQEPQELITEWIEAAKHTYAKEVELKAGARELLSELRKRGIRLGISTSCSSEMFLPALRRNGVEALFDAITTTSELGVGKTDPAVYLRTAEKLELQPEQCLVLEDLPVGIRTASGAGFLTYGVRDLPEQWEALCQVADCAGESLLQLAELLKTSEKGNL